MISVQELIDMMGEYEAEDCSYLPNHQEVIRAIRCPGLPPSLHGDLTVRGFRRSKDLFYTTQCPGCNQCIPIRIDPKKFTPTKKQRHIFNKNKDVEIYLAPPEANEEKYDLFKRYTECQHPDSMEHMSFNSLKSLLHPMPSTLEVQYKLDGKMIGITVADIAPKKAFSSVYHFYDPDYANRSIGVFSMVAEIKLTESMKIPYFYPGLWIPECKKMNYKNQYRPNEILVDGVWRDNEER